MFSDTAPVAVVRGRFPGAGYWRVTISVSAKWTGVTSCPGCGDCGSCEDTKTLVLPDATVVGVEKIIVDGSDPPVGGPLSVCTNESLKLRAIPTPGGASFPANQPRWTMDGNNVGSGPTCTVIPRTGGKHVVVATCGPPQGDCPGSKAEFELNAVGLDKIVIASDPEWDRPAILTAGKSITIRAKLNPAGADPPPLKPEWSLGTHPKGVKPADVTLPANGSLEGTVTVPKPGHYVILASMCNKTAKFEIFAYTVRLKQVTFQGGGFHDVFEDTGAKYAPPHYLVNAPRPPTSKPVCYVRNSPLQLQVKCTLEGEQKDKATGKLRATAHDLFSMPWTATSVTGGMLTATLTTTESFPNAIAKLTLDMDYRCRLRDDPPDDETGVGSSRNKVYVTLATPKADKLYETLLEIGCTSAAGATNDAEGFAGIWSAFAGRNLSRVDGAVLTYYNPANKVYGVCKTVPKMLSDTYTAPTRQKYSIGNCKAWAAFLIECVKAQGIAGTKMVTITAKGPNANGFLVNNWTFQNPPPYRFSETSLSGDLVGPRNVIDNPGVPGQSNNDPPSNFGNHVIVRYNFGDPLGITATLWDPSYGHFYADGRDYEDGPASPIKDLRFGRGVGNLWFYEVVPNTVAPELNFP